MCLATVREEYLGQALIFMAGSALRGGGGGGGGFNFYFGGIFASVGKAFVLGWGLGGGL